MHLLGIDYGRKKIGLAIANSKIAEPYRVLFYKSYEEVVGKIKKVIQVEEIDQVVIGVSEGKMDEETRAFGRWLKAELGIPVDFFDETLTTFEAKDLSIKAGIKRIKRKKMEDAFAATVMLQSYLDRNV